MNHHLKPLLGSKRIDEISRAAVERLMRDAMAGKTAAPKPKKGERKPCSPASGGSAARQRGAGETASFAAGAGPPTRPAAARRELPT